MQSSIALQDTPGFPFRQAINAALETLITQNAGPTEPSPAYAFQWWADTTTGILKQRNAANNDWVEILDLATGRPVGAVAQTSPTGALLLAEGTDTERPAPEDIPVGVAAVRGNSTSLTDYFLELWDRKTEVWDAIASRPWVKAITDALTNRVSNLESDIGFAIIYPNGGTKEAPANIAIASVYVEPNPFPDHHVMTEVQLQQSGVWYTVTTQGYNSMAAGVVCGQTGDTIRIVTNSSTLILASGGYFNSTSTVGSGSSPLPCRVKVWKVKGSAA